MKYKLWVMTIFITLLIITKETAPVKPRKVHFNTKLLPKNIIKRKNLKEKNCKLFQTKWSVAGWNDNEIKYFHKHHVKCPPNQALKYFRLFTNNKRAKLQRGSYSMRFKYICCEVKTFNCEKKNSKNISGTNLYTLARIGKIKCGCEKVFTGFHIKTTFDNYGKNPQTNISYNCCALYQEGLKHFNSSRKSSGYTDSGFGRNIYLDKHQISCGRNGFIRSIHAITKAKNQSGFNPYLKFKYSCLLPVISKKSKKETKSNVKKRNKKVETIQKLLALGINQSKNNFMKN